MIEYYLENPDGTVRECADLMEWAKGFERKDKWQVRETIHTEQGPVDVSTVFLGLNHAFRDTDPPLIYETMIFGGEHDYEQWRYSTRAEAIEGHEEAKALVKKDATVAKAEAQP